MRKLLEKGDIIRIEKGMKVNALVPKNVYYAGLPFSLDKTEKLIEIGRVYQSNPPSKKGVANKVNRFLEKEFHTQADKNNLTTFVDSLDIDYEIKSFDTSCYEGEYIVEKARYLNMRIMPYKVVCYKKDEPNKKVSFYQYCPYLKPNIDKEIPIIGHIHIE